MADTINLETSQKIISVQGLNHYHKKAMIEVDEKIAGISGAVVDDSLSATSTNAIQNKAVTNALNAKANLTDIPSSLPASGGDASTVNGHTVNADVPANAKFTDTNTTYSAGTWNRYINIRHDYQQQRRALGCEWKRQWYYISQHGWHGR